MTRSPLISVSDLAARLGEPGLVVLDASLPLPGVKGDPAGAFAERHIPGARFFDIEAFSDHASGFPHTLLGPADFERMARDLGVNDSSTIVAYDTAGLYSAARAWWNFRVFGAPDVLVLDGGLPAWVAAGHPVSNETSPVEPGDFTARFDASLVRSYEDVLAIIADGSATIIDARGAARFRGEAPEPRAGLASGHMAGSRNVPFASLVSADGRLRPPADLENEFRAAGIDLALPIVASCGSGVTAAVDALALAVLGRSDVAIYDGSWSEFAVLNDGSAIRTGPASP